MSLHTTECTKLSEEHNTVSHTTISKQTKYPTFGISSSFSSKEFSKTYTATYNRLYTESLCLEWKSLTKWMKWQKRIDSLNRQYLALVKEWKVNTQFQEKEIRIILRMTVANRWAKVAGNLYNFTLSLLTNILIEPIPGTASFCIMNDILQKLAVPRWCVTLPMLMFYIRYLYFSSILMCRIRNRTVPNHYIETCSPGGVSLFPCLCVYYIVLAKTRRHPHLQ